jgi:hypothetical protein
MQKIISLLLFFGLITCSTTNSSKKESAPIKEQLPGFYLPTQQLPPNYIKSVFLGRSSSVGLPVIALNSNTQLELRFDDVREEASSYQIRFRRYTKDWEEDGLVPTQISKGQLEDVITGMTRSEGEFPVFFQHSYSFPNSQIQFILSGNWMLEVVDAFTGETQFTLPFFVTEQAGKTEIEYETLNEIRYNSRYQHQFFVFYDVPENLQLPEFNLSTYMVQDGQFFDSKELDIKDLSRANEGVIRYHHGRDNLFLANYDHQLLNLKKLEENQEIRFVEERRTQPPFVWLNDDIPSFEQTNTSSLVNFPSRNRLERYAEVMFSFSPTWPVETNDKIYVTGAFAQWGLRPEFELRFDEEQQRYVTKALIKQGEYAYSYAVTRNGVIQQNLAQNPFGETRRSYAVFVYYNDPTRFIDRLLHIREFETK